MAAIFRAFVRVSPARKGLPVKSGSVSVDDAASGVIKLGPFAPGDVIEEIFISGRPVGTGAQLFGIGFTSNKDSVFANCTTFLTNGLAADGHMMISSFGTWVPHGLPINRVVDDSSTWIIVNFDLTAFTTAV